MDFRVPALLTGVFGTAAWMAQINMKASYGAIAKRVKRSSSLKLRLASPLGLIADRTSLYKQHKKRDRTSIFPMPS